MDAKLFLSSHTYARPVKEGRVLALGGPAGGAPEPGRRLFSSTRAARDAAPL